MKTMRSDKAIKNVNELKKIINKRKKLEDQEKVLKSWFIAQNQSVIKIGELIVIVTDCEQTSIDRKRIIEDHGEGFLRKYTNTTSYKKVEVK